MDKIIEYIKNLINENIVSINCCSRLLHKNVVFDVVTDENRYAVKIYFNGTDKESRFETEMHFYKYFSNSKLINVPLIYNEVSSQFGKILIMKWIDGDSLKKKVKNEKLDAFCFVERMLDDMEKIWSITDLKIKRFLIIDEVGLDKRIGLHEDEIIKKIIQFKPNINFDEILDIYKYLKNIITPSTDYIINSDVSMHEYIIFENDGYWIDFERFRLGDPNNDLARSFQSLTNGIYVNSELCNKIFEMYSSSYFYNQDIFIYYLIEKLLTSIYIAKEQVLDEEINFYIDFIKKIYSKENNFCKKKQRLK